MSQPHQQTDPPQPTVGSLGHYNDTEWDITTGVGFTALAVAAGRAMETHRPDGLITDPQAASFVTAAQTRTGEASIPVPTGWPPQAPTEATSAGVDTDALHQLWAAMATYLGVRSRFFDHELAHACYQHGIRQVVLLAAGLDTAPTGWTGRPAPTCSRLTTPTC